MGREGIDIIRKDRVLLQVRIAIKRGLEEL